MFAPQDPVLALNARLELIRLQLSKDAVRKFKTYSLTYISNLLIFQFVNQFVDSHDELSQSTVTFVSAANNVKLMIGSMCYLVRMGLCVMQMSPSANEHSEAHLREIYLNDPEKFARIEQGSVKMLRDLQEEEQRRGNAVNWGDGLSHLFNLKCSYHTFGQMGTVASAAVSAGLEVAELVSDLRM